MAKGCCRLDAARHCRLYGAWGGIDGVEVSFFPTVASIVATCGFMWAYSCANEGREFSEAKDKDSVTVGFLELYGALATVLVLVMAFV